MSIIIPQRWRTAVVAILDQPQEGTILLRKRPRREWSNLDDEHTEFGLYALLADELSVAGDLYGKVHTDMDEEGECYSFSFRYHPPSAKGEIELYTKLNLLPDGQVVIIYSAHT
jgi:hypothetical protein